MAGGYDDSDWQAAEPALRAADTATTKEAERKHASRFPPIWIDRPRGSYLGSVVLLSFAGACLVLVLYDLGVLWRPVQRESEGVVTLVRNERPGLDRQYVAVAYDGTESLFRIEATQVIAAEGDMVTVVTHSRYFDRHVQIVRSVNRTALYVEPEHSLTLNGLLGMLGMVVFGVLAAVQTRLAYSQHRRDRAWIERNAGA